jgi:stage II sporulation protein M
MVSKKKGKKFNLKEEYSKSWNYIKSSKNFIYAGLLIFLVFVLGGFLFPASQDIYNLIADYIQKILAQTEGLSAGGLISFIFFNNIQSSFFGMVLGVLFGVFPLIALIFNGYLVGFVSKMSVDSSGWISLLNLLPHGIFELPAIFISLGLGLKLGTFWFKKNKRKSFENYFFESLRVFVFVVLPLLIIAAIIEGSLIAFIK